ncbi:Myosin regulatory light chain 1 [Metarhizium anisopliae]|nr:Myosin regulatory light chain 1 [Metarhizium anisopliae]
MTPSSPHRSSQQTSVSVSQPLASGNALSQLQPAQVRTLRDGFQILDRDCDGMVNREDVADMLSQLGAFCDDDGLGDVKICLPNSASDVSQFFPPSKSQTIALAAFLNSLAETLCQLSPSAELLSAFSAFDDDDSGQVDWAELRDALLNTAPEPGERPLAAAEVERVVNGFTGRRAFNRNINAQLGAKKGEVFKYNEFVNSIMGSNGASEGSSQENSEEQ